MRVATPATTLRKGGGRCCLRLCELQQSSSDKCPDTAGAGCTDFSPILYFYMNQQAKDARAVSAQQRPNQPANDAVKVDAYLAICSAKDNSRPSGRTQIPSKPSTHAAPTNYLRSTLSRTATSRYKVREPAPTAASRTGVKTTTCHNNRLCDEGQPTAHTRESCLAVPATKTEEHGKLATRATEEEPPSGKKNKGCPRAPPTLYTTAQPTLRDEPSWSRALLRKRTPKL